jgi:hypothetical protein
MSHQFIDAAFSRTRTNRRYLAGDRFEKLVLVQPDYHESLYGRSAHSGWWIAKCECGRECRVHTQWLRMRLRKGRACPICAPSIPRSNQKQTAVNGEGEKRVGRKELPLAGLTIGRLLVISWVEGAGWVCECRVCGGGEIVRTSYRTLQRGVVACNGHCGEPDGEDQSEGVAGGLRSKK